MKSIVSQIMKTLRLLVALLLGNTSAVPVEINEKQKGNDVKEQEIDQQEKKFNNQNNKSSNPTSNFNGVEEGKSKKNHL